MAEKQEAKWQAEAPEYMGWRVTDILKQHLMKDETSRIFDNDYDAQYLRGARDACLSRGKFDTTDQNAAKKLTALLEAIEMHGVVRVNLK